MTSLHNEGNNEQNEIEIRSQEVQEIMGIIPRWIIRQGLFIFTLIFTTVIITSSIINIPEYIYADCTTSSNQSFIVFTSPYYLKIDKYPTNNEKFNKGSILLSGINLVDNKEFVIKSPYDCESHILRNLDKNTIFKKNDTLCWISPISSIITLHVRVSETQGKKIIKRHFVSCDLLVNKTRYEKFDSDLNYISLLPNNSYQVVLQLSDKSSKSILQKRINFTKCRFALENRSVLKQVFSLFEN